MLIKDLRIEADTTHIIAVVGGGGKTSLIFQLQREFFALNKRVIICTTTHMAWDAKLPFSAPDQIDHIECNLKKYGYAVVGRHQPEDKIASCTNEEIAALQKHCDVLLIEADGSKQLPMKVPRSHEPVIPDLADLVIGVIGLDALGEAIDQVCHHPEHAALFLGKNASDRITMEDILRIAESDKGLRKNVYDKNYRVFLNKADIVSREIRDSLHQKLKEHGIKGVCGSIRQRDKIGIVMLAAGYGRRFGSNKLLHRIQGKPMYQHMLEKAQKLSKMDFAFITVTVVTQYREIYEDAKERGIHALYNPEPDRGISSSLKIGLEANMEADAVMFAVSDQPWIRLETLKKLLTGFLLSSKGIAAAGNQELMGNPCIFQKRYYAELLELTGDAGGKRVAKRHMDDVLLVTVPEGRELEDIDHSEMG